MKRHKAKIGDVFEFEFEEKFFYLQFVFEDYLGCLVRLLDYKQTRKLERGDPAFASPTKYYFYYSIKRALLDGDCVFVSNEPIPLQDQKKPILIAGISHRPGPNCSWRISYPDGSQEHVQRLEEHQKYYSHESIIGHGVLEIYLRNNWTPYEDTLNYERGGENMLKQYAVREGR